MKRSTLKTWRPRCSFLPGLALCLLLGGASLSGAREFLVAVYNVENLFDIDGVARYEDYREDGPDALWGPGPLLRKVDGIVELMAQLGEGRGPDIILFQEVERDHTARKRHFNWADFQRRFRTRTLAEMLDDPGPEVRSLPAVAFLWKRMEERGLAGYSVAMPENEWRRPDAPVHINPVFSRFPVRAVRQHRLQEARDILEVEVCIDGHRLILLNNHWKSGASNPEMEVVRVQNAAVLRARVEEILRRDPWAEIVIGGDLNSHYNQHLVYPEMAKVAIREVLGSVGDEAAWAAGERDGFYNLWYELPPERRRSDTWRGEWGTLMHLLVSRGLYDGRGIEYVNDSFSVLAVPGLNAHPVFGTPVRWRQTGGGAGFSDHFPLVARFRVVSGSNGPLPRSPGWSSEKPEVDGRRLLVDYALKEEVEIPLAGQLLQLPESAWPDQVGSLFLVEGAITRRRPLMLRFGGREWEVFAPDRELMETLRADPGQPLRVVAELGEFRGRLQWVVRHPTWVR